MLASLCYCSSALGRAVSAPILGLAARLDAVIAVGSMYLACCHLEESRAQSGLSLFCEELLCCDSHSRFDLLFFFNDYFYFFLWKLAIPMVTIRARGSD